MKQLVFASMKGHEKYIRR